jgi:hypothetical protein
VFLGVGFLCDEQALTTAARARPAAQALMHVQVQASVTQPAKLQSRVTNTFNFLFRVRLREDGQGRVLPLMKVLPSTGESRAWWWLQRRHGRGPRVSCRVLRARLRVLGCMGRVHKVQGACCVPGPRPNAQRRRF